MSETTVAVVGGRDLQVWIAAILLYGVGDTATTLWGLSTGGIAEAGPIAKPLIEAYGPHALLFVKAVVFGSFYVVWAGLRTPGRIAVPLALALVGGVITAWNLFVVASVT
jgi:hypothetical protein